MINAITPAPPPLSSLLRKDLLQILFQRISPMDYVALGMILKYAKDTGQEKLYLKDLAQAFQLPVDDMSKAVRILQSKGYIQWSHDGLGQEGTYLYLNREALDPALSQKEYLSDFFQQVIQEFGQERFLALMNEASQLEELMWQQAWKEGEPDPVYP